MSWHLKYWDAVDNFYWTPSHLGLVSIPRQDWGSDPGLIQIRRSRIRHGSTIYTRVGTSKENAIRMQGLEETLNHIFDITFSIASDAVLSEVMHKRLGIDDPGPFERLGREVQLRYGWQDNNVTQHDGFFISPSSLVAVELKLGSATWREQVLKYLAMMVLEERHSGVRPHLGLLFITPHETATEIWKRCGATREGTLSSEFLSHCRPAKVNGTIRKLLDDDSAAFDSAVARLKLAHVSWREMAVACEVLGSTLDLARAGDETLARLLDGFVAAVRSHQGTRARD